MCIRDSSIEDNYRIIPGDSQAGVLEEIKGTVSNEQSKNSME